jgi:hypothetical protein
MLGCCEESDIALIGGVPPRELSPLESICNSLRDNDSIRVRFVKDSSRNESIMQKLEAVDIAGSPSLSTSHRKRKAVAFGSEEDIGEDLITALGKGVSGEKSRMLRSIFWRAVSLQYDDIKAEARLSSAIAGRYTIIESTTSKFLGSSASAEMTVEFDKGPGFRGVYSETVDLIDETKLKGVIGLLISSYGLEEDDESSNENPTTAREMLKPINMSKCSPRMFWSIVRLYGADFESCFHAMFPDKDWSFLYARKKTLSGKAISNRNQEKERHQRQRRHEIEEKESSTVNFQSISSILPSAVAPLTYELRNILKSASSEVRSSLTDSTFDHVKSYATSYLDSNRTISDEDVIHLASAADSIAMNIAATNVSSLNEVIFCKIIQSVAQKLLASFSIEPSSMKRAFICLTDGCRVKSLRQLIVWRHSTAMFLSMLNRSAYAISIASINRFPIGPFVEDDVSEMLNVLYAFCESFPWAHSYPLTNAANTNIFSSNC